MMMGPFIYSASSVAVAAKFDGPHALNKVWATAVLPMIGGEDIATEKGPNGNPVLSFGSATAHVKGWESPSGVFNTWNTVTVTSLTVLNELIAEKIEVSLRFAFTKNPEKLTVDVKPKNPYTNLWIADEDYSDVVLEDDLPKSAAGKKHDKFCEEDLPVKRKDEHHIHQKLKTAFTYISKDPKKRLKCTKTEHGYRDFDFGRVYFCEWASENDWQGVVGLRIDLKSSDLVTKGEIVIADWIGNNGQFYP